MYMNETHANDAYTYITYMNIHWAGTTFPPNFFVLRLGKRNIKGVFFAIICECECVGRNLMGFHREYMMICVCVLFKRSFQLNLHNTAEI